MKRNAKVIGLTLNEYLVANIAQTMNELNDGKNTGHMFTSVSPIGFHKQSQLDEIPFKPTNNIGSVPLNFRVEDNLRDTALNFRESAEILHDLDRVKYFRWHLKMFAKIMVTYAPFNGMLFRHPILKKAFSNTDFILTNMAGPRQKWKFFGGELQSILIGIPAAYYPYFGFATVGDIGKLVLTFEVGQTDTEKAKHFIKTIEKKLVFA